MTEWSNVPHLKCGIPERVSEVRILSPPFVVLFIGPMRRFLISTTDALKGIFVFIFKWAYLLLFLVPIGSYFLVLNYYVPEPFHIRFEYMSE